MTDITIPREALSAAAKIIRDSFYNITLRSIITNDSNAENVASAACLAMLKAWPGSYSLTENDSAEIRDVAAIILPLTENTNDKG
jgi:hypothetical protein